MDDLPQENIQIPRAYISPFSLVVFHFFVLCVYCAVNPAPNSLFSANFHSVFSKKGIWVCFVLDLALV